MRNTSITSWGNVLKQARSALVGKHVAEQGMRIQGRSMAQTRQFAAAAAASSEPSYTSEATSSRSTRSSASQSQTLTPERASSYLNSLLSLPSSRPFPPQLALQVLTHKSYRAAHLLGYGHQSRSGGASSAIEAERNGSAPHNARLAFLGKRALVSYLMMFLHQQALAGAIPTSSVAESAETIAQSSSSSASSSRTATLTGLNINGEFGMAGTFEEKIANLTHRTNLGREVGQQWGLEDVMRWQNNWTDAVAQQNGSLTVQGETVTAVLGGTLMYFGSPAAHRLFHLHVLPHLSRQFKSTPQIQEAIQAQRRVAAEQLDGGVVVP